MAAQRPNVIVYQEYETLTVSPDIPDLHVLIVGPCNQILDYLDDKDDCYADEYGELDANSPLVSPSAVILSDPPNVMPGGELIASSVDIYFDEARAVLLESTAGLGTPDKGQYSLGDNLFIAHTTAGGAHFGSEGVAPGDILIVNPAAGTADYIMTVNSVIYALNDFGGTLDFQTNGVQAGDIVILTNDNPPGGGPRNGTYEVVRVRDDETLEFTGLNWVGHAEDSFGGANTVTITITDPNGAVRSGYPATVELADYSDLRMTSDFSANSIANRDWRVERDASDLELDSGDFSVSGNEITINGGITVDLSSVLTGKKISYAKIYVQYMAKRSDLQIVNTFSNYSEMVSSLGKYDSRNPLFTGCVVAKANTTTAIKAYAVTDDTLTAYLDFIDRISTVRDVYAIVPLTYDTSILAALNSMAEQLADPNEVLTRGIKQKFRVILGAVDLITQKYMVNESNGGYTSQKSATAPSGVKTLTFSQVGGTNPNFSTAGIVPGDIVEVFDSGGATTTYYTVAHLNDLLVLETDEVLTTVTLNTATDHFKIWPAAEQGTWTPGQEKVDMEVGVGGVTSFTVTGSALDNLYLIFEAAGANFIVNGVIPGDIIEIPEDPTVDSWSTGVQSWVITDVISNERVAIVNNGTNTSTLANELPHLYKREDGAALTGGLIWFRVLRNLTKAQQVDEVVAVAESFASKRLILAFPDEVDVAGLVDGSKERTDSTIPELADAQPGYYLACAIGGLTAGQPPQQGFTNMGIAGISRIYNSSDYFSEEQLTDLSNGGIYTFIQDNPSALPYSIHEVTTDVSALEFSEYMVVKDFDFVAWTFLDTLLPFIGPYNVNRETIEFIRQALFTTGDTLKSRYVAKIGAPLDSYTLDGVETSSLSPDRIEAYIDVNLPMTLNTIGLHLVA